MSAPSCEPSRSRRSSAEGDERRSRVKSAAGRWPSVPYSAVVRSARHFPPARSRQGGHVEAGSGGVRPRVRQGSQVNERRGRAARSDASGLLAVERTRHSTCRRRQGVQQFGHRGCSPHRGVQDRDFSGCQRRGRRADAVVLFRRGRCLQTEENSAVGEVIGRYRRWVGGRQVSPSNSPAEGAYPSLRGGYCSGPRSGRFETADDDLFRISSPQGHVQRESACNRRRVGPVDQQRLFDRQPEQGRRGGCSRPKGPCRAPRRPSRLRMKSCAGT